MGQNETIVIRILLIAEKYQFEKPFYEVLVLFLWLNLVVTYHLYENDMHQIENKKNVFIKKSV